MSKETKEKEEAKLAGQKQTLESKGQPVTQGVKVSGKEPDEVGHYRCKANFK